MNDFPLPGFLESVTIAQAANGFVVTIHKPPRLREYPAFTKADFIEIAREARQDPLLQSLQDDRDGPQERFPNPVYVFQTLKEVFAFIEVEMW